MQQQVIDERQPLLSMVVSPRETFRYSLQEKSFSLTLYIGAAGGFSNEIINYFQQPYPKNGYLPELIYNSMLSGIIGYLLATFILSFFLQQAGKLFGAQSTFKTVFQVLCLATIPFIWALPIALFWMQLSPVTYFEANLNELSVSNIIILIMGSLLIFGIAIWNFILMLIGLSEAMKISKLKAFWTFSIVFVVAIIVLMGIAFVI